MLRAGAVGGGAFALTLVVVVVCVSWVLTRQQSDRVTSAHPDDKAAQSAPTAPPNAKPAAFLPPKDVPGKDVTDLPRYPGSIRTEYEHDKQEQLHITRIRYLSPEKLDVIRGFYRGVFRSNGWKVANVEFSDGEWTFLAVKSRREANIDIRSHDPGAEVDIELSEPLGKQGVTPKETPQKREASPAPPQPSQSATPTPAPQSVSPAPQSATAVPAPRPVPQPVPAPDDYERGGDGWDDRDDGGDD